MLNMLNVTPVLFISLSVSLYLFLFLSPPSVCFCTYSAVTCVAFFLFFSFLSFITQFASFEFVKPSFKSVTPLTFVYLVTSRSVLDRLTELPVCDGQFLICFAFFSFDAQKSCRSRTNVNNVFLRLLSRKRMNRKSCRSWCQVVISFRLSPSIRLVFSWFNLCKLSRFSHLDLFAYLTLAQDSLTYRIVCIRHRYVPPQPRILALIRYQYSMSSIRARIEH